MRSTTCQAVEAWAQDLDPQQRAAAGADGGHLLVVAGAGSGKTRTLAARVARLVDTGVPPEAILLLTFTRRAAREMLDRAARACGREGVARVRGGTFHSVALAELRRWGRLVGLPPTFSVLDPGDVTELFSLVRTELGAAAGEVRFPRPATIAEIYSRMVSTQHPLTDVLDNWYPWCRDHREALTEIFTACTQRKAEQALLDFDDLLVYWRALLSTPGTGPAELRHVLVDEAQDMNRVQVEILEGLADRGARITAVGDDAQAVYGFRGADVTHMHEFTDHFAGTEVLFLDHNYRSTPEICRAADAVIAEADSPFARDMTAARRAGVMPVLATCFDESAQAAYVCDRILEHREEGMSLRDQAVLVRAAHHSDVLELELRRRDIPYTVYGGLRFLERGHVKDFLALLRVLDNPRDSLAFNRVLRLLDGVGPATARRWLEELGVGSGDPTAPDPLCSFCAGEITVPARARADYELLVAAIGDCTAEPAPTPAGQAERLVDLCRELLPRRYDDAPARLGDLEVLAAAAREHPTRASFVGALVLDPPTRTGALASTPHLDEDWLVVSTIHGVKGLEFRAVHVIHAADGNIPSDLATGDARQVAEERRLLYVAMTRARDHLYVSWPLRFYHHRSTRRGSHNWAQLSRFLAASRHTFRAEQVGWVGDDPAAADQIVSRPDAVRRAVSALWA
ncbi:MAG: ATP-dependent helicase [Acidimicrobiia bacterium]|nr:ATP-dependent helicase [Acidimicrobiia bacterium]